MPTIKISRGEIDLRRLLAKCEQMANEGDINENWKLPKFIESAESILRDLKNIKIEKENVDSYSKRISFLKGLLEAKKMENSIEKSIALQMLAPNSVPNSNKVKEIYLKNVANCENSLRDELLQEPSYLRHRAPPAEPSGSKELDSMLKYHHEKHEHIANDMLTMTRTMKEHSELAGKIIREDTKVLEKSSKIMDDNYYSLQKQSGRLQDFISKSGWRCWIWIMLGLMVIIFINMVFFMKLMKKKY
ncbi:vesicle transport protein USE1 [Planococcus citri]|uniref:vesicle transport protein USE1 n=1 Tax=Planococcus citri TaxID=170843 RepID=UPI0031F7CC93